MKLQEIFNKTKSVKASLDGNIYNICSCGEILNENNIPASLNMAQILSDRWEIENNIKKEESFIGRENYYYISSELLVRNDSYDEVRVDKTRVAAGNVFKNKQYAEIVALQNKINNKLMTIAYLNNSKDFNIYDESTTKYSIETYDNICDGFRICIDEFDTIVDDVAIFETRELAEKALDFIKDDCVKLFQLKKEYYNERVGD